MSGLTFDWDLPPGEPVAVACSGGADSFALLHVLHEKSVPIVCLTVDHGLRPEAADEARAVAEWCTARGILHETLVWRRPSPAKAPFDTEHPRDGEDLDPPKTGSRLRGNERQEKASGNLQAQARTARYRLLCQACNRLGLEILVTGHTAEDQAETVFMRLRRGSARGLAGMPSKRLIAGGAGEPVTLYRPMLSVRRAEARAYAEEHDLPFCDDPSNEDEKYERVQVRALLAALGQQSLLTVEALCGVATETQSILDDVSVAHAWDDTDYDVSEGPDGAFDCWSGDWIDDLEIDEDTKALFARHAADFFRRIIYAVGGVSIAKTTSIPDVRTGGRLAVAGVILNWPGEGTMHVFREPAALLGRADGAGGFTPITVSAGEKHVYDRRFIVTMPDDIGPLAQIVPLGSLLPRDIATSTLDRQRVSTLPCLTQEGRLTHLPRACVDFVAQALKGWKRGEEYLTGVGVVETESLLEERFLNRVIRF